MPPYLNEYYNRYGQQMLPFPPFPPQRAPQLPVIHANWVTIIEEARASQLSDFIATNIYLDTGSGKIYLKRMGDNGKPQFITYAIENDAVEKDPLSEINLRLSNIENYLGGIKDESISSDAGVQKSATVSQSAVAVTNESNGTTESAGVSKNAGNDQWKKRSRHEANSTESC